MLNDDWILRNVGDLTPEAAKFLIERVERGTLKISRESIDALRRRAFGQVGGAVPPGPDWAERAAGEHG